MTRRIRRIAALAGIAVLVCAATAFAFFRVTATSTQAVSAAKLGELVAAASPSSPYPSVCPGGYADRIDNTGYAANGTGDAIQINLGTDALWAGNPNAFSCVITLQAAADLPGDQVGTDAATVTLTPSGGFSATLRDLSGNPTTQIGQGQQRRVDLDVPTDAPTTNGTLRIDLDFEDGTHMHYTVDVGWTNS